MNVVKTRYGDFEIFENDSGAVSESLREYGEWAENELAFLRNFVREGAVVVDVGGYIGTHAVAFASSVGPSGTVVSIEPQAASFELLSRNIARNELTQVRAIHAAAGAAPGQATIRAINPDEKASFGSQALRPAADDAEALAVSVMTIDSLALPACDLIKVDVEGLEDEVIAGAADTIRRHRPVIYAECNSIEDGMRAWYQMRQHDGIRVRLHVVPAYNPANFAQSNTNIFGDGKEAALVGYFERHVADLPTMPDDSGALLLDVQTADDLALGLLHKPQYPVEVLAQGAAARTGGSAWLVAQDDLRRNWHGHQEAVPHHRRLVTEQEDALARATDGTEALQRLLTEREDALARATDDIDALRSQLASQVRDADTARAVAADRQALVDAMRASTSWRLTAPLRRLAALANPREPAPPLPRNPARPESGGSRPAEGDAPVGPAGSPSRISPLSAMRGCLEQVSRFGVAGWAQDERNPDRRVIAGIYLGDTPVGATVCQEYREDLAAAGIGDGRHGFLHAFTAPIKAEDVRRIRIVADGTEVRPIEHVGTLRRCPFVLPTGLSALETASSWQGIDFSQYGEQAFITKFFDENPDAPRFVIDLGAYDGEIGSNSRALILKGWSGVLVEPDPRTFARLSVLYADRPDILCVRCAVSDAPAFLEMQFTTGPAQTSSSDAWKYAQVNTLQTDLATRVSSELGYSYTKHRVAVSTLSAVMDWAHAPKDVGFLSIDCEGVDVKIIRSIDFSRCRPWLISVECDDHSRHEMEAVLLPAGYEEYAKTTANTLFSWRGATSER